jgi:tetratricopeptide (TPR) repeat protein
MAKQPGFRRDATPAPASFHEYAEAAAEWVFRYKFTVIVAVAVLVGVVLLWARRGGRSAGESRAWEKFSEAATAEELEQNLGGLKETSAYPWAALRVGSFYYGQHRFTDAERVLEPLADDEKAPAYPRGLALYVLGCAYLEVGNVALAKNSFEKALTVNEKSPFLQELVARQEAALVDWPPKASAGEQTTSTPAGGGAAEATTAVPAASGGEAQAPAGGSGGTTQPPAAGGGEAATAGPDASGGEKTAERPAAGGETRSEAPTGGQ